MTIRGRIGFLLQRYVEDPWNAGNPDALDEVRTDDLELGSGWTRTVSRGSSVPSHGDMNRRVRYGRETYGDTADLQAMADEAANRGLLSAIGSRA